jgi:hypothetical protein
MASGVGMILWKRIPLAMEKASCVQREGDPNAEPNLAAIAPSHKIVVIDIPMAIFNSRNHSNNNNNQRNKIQHNDRQK